MLPYIIGIGVISAVGYFLDNSEKSRKNNRRKKLEQREEKYEKKLERRNEYNQQKKRSILFKQIKYEQSQLKVERRKLAEIRNTLQRGSLEHKKVVQQIEMLSSNINQKQKDADNVRG